MSGSMFKHGWMDGWMKEWTRQVVGQTDEWIALEFALLRRKRGLGNNKNMFSVKMIWRNRMSIHS